MKIYHCFFVFFILFFTVSFWHHSVKAATSLNDLQIDFGSPSATLPLDRYAEHTYAITNTSTQAKTVSFTIHIQETDQELVGWPQPQTLYFDPGETEIVKTFLDEKWGVLDKTKPGDQSRTLIWTFIDQTTSTRRVEKMRFPITVLDPQQITGDLTITGTVLDTDGQPTAETSVSLSTGVGGYTIQATTDAAGKFRFSQLPSHTGWFLKAGGQSSQNFPANRSANQCAPPPAPCNPPGGQTTTTATARHTTGGVAFAFLEPTVTDYTLKLVAPQATGNYSVTKTITDEIGIWKGAVDDKETKILVIQGMENWKDPSLKTKAQLQLYSFAGELLWAYDMGWEGWGVDLSRDGSYAAFTTSNGTRNLGVIDAATGQPLWVKSGGEFRWSDLSEAGESGGIDSKEIKISSTNTFVGVGHGGGEIALADLKTGEIKWHTDLHGQVRGIVFDPTDEYVYAGSGDGRAYKLKTSDGSLVWQADIGSWPFTGGFKLSKDGAYLGSASKFGEVTVIETATGQRLWQTSQSGNASWLDFSPDGAYVFAGGGGQGAGTLYEKKTGKKLMRTGLYSHQGRFSRDSQTILVGDQAVQVYDLAGNSIANVETKKTSATLSEGSGQFAYISNDGTKIVYSHRDIDPGATMLVFAEGSIRSTGSVTTQATEKPTLTELRTNSAQTTAPPARDRWNLLILGLFGFVFLLGLIFMLLRIRLKHFPKP